jgi:predicted protein tyrosine phosphatase
VTAPGRSLAELAGFERVLRLSFADVDHLSPDLSARAKAKVAEAFTLEQACQVIVFGEALESHVHDLVVHCEGGFSRSCAIAKFLREQFGFEAEVDRLHDANKSVLEVLHRAARSESTRR